MKHKDKEGITLASGVAAGSAANFAAERNCASLARSEH